MTAHAVRALGPLAVILGLGLPGSASAGQRGSPLAVELEVSTSIGGPDEALLSEAVEERARARLEALGHSVGTDEPIDLRVSVGWYDEAETTYVLAVVLRHHGELLHDGTETCPRCGTAELFEVLARRIDRVEEHLASIAAKQARAEAETRPPDDAPAQRVRPRPRLAGLGWAGVAAAGTGLVVGSVGASLWSKGKVIEPDSHDDLWLVGKDYRPPGIALVVIGGTLLAGGIAMLVVDVARARHRRVRVAGAFERTAAVAVVTGRF